MASNKVKVVIPENPDEYLILIKTVITKEESLAPNGTLSAAELTEFTALSVTAFNANKQKKELEKLAEEKTRERDNAFGRAEGQGVDTPNTTDFFITQLRDLLLAKNKTNPKALGAWGFEVNDASKGEDTPPTP